MIRTDELVYRYGETAAIDGISLAIPDGEFVVIAGANGSGKTTLVRHFNGLLSPEEGSVSVDGTDVDDDVLAARTAVGMVFQNPRDCFVAATVAADVAFGPENLGLPRAEIDARVEAALSAVGMTGREDERIDRLSGGEQARVAIAGALAMEPSHLILDEPFSGLDWPARKRLLGHLETLHDAGRSIVVVTHDLRDFAPLSDRIVLLADGTIVADGPVEAVRDDLAEFGVRPP